MKPHGFRGKNGPPKRSRGAGDARRTAACAPERGPRREPRPPGQAESPRPDSAGDLIYGVHSVVAALREGKRQIERLYLSRDRNDSRIHEVHRHARERGIPAQFVPAATLDRLAGGAHHQGVAAVAAAAAYAGLERILESFGSRGVLLCLDGIQDPRNLGAILRTAAASGVRGVVIPTHGACGLTGVVARTAAGALERVPVARVPNLAALALDLKNQGFAAIGLDARGADGWSAGPYPDRVALFIGGEDGLRDLVRRRCDRVVRIPMVPGSESLNVSVAAAVVLYEIVRQAGGVRTD